MTEEPALCLLQRLDDPLDVRARSRPGGRGHRNAHGRSRLQPRLPPGQEGELWFRGRVVTPGYYGKPEETAQAFTADGWFKTGDLGVRDALGHTFFRSRLREALRISHFMVSPAEIEAYLMTHPKVLQGFVVGVPDPRMNEAAVAYVIPRAGEPPTRPS
jgi:acyl-CoA synthetase (AMP-forming)/AMP-acid ligase II